METTQLWVHFNPILPRIATKIAAAGWLVT
jgi:hypothetical protein